MREGSSKVRGGIAGALAVVALATGAQGQPFIGAGESPVKMTPYVVETTPTLGARGVDPTLGQLEVRFNRPMRTTSWSWCGGGESYPEIAGKPSFKDEWTAVLPVRLRPLKTYNLLINCPAGQNFVSAEGLPARPQEFTFSTGEGVGEATAPKSTAPTVVETTPTLGARDVDPGLKELAVRFDRPMSTGSWSWCGGGASYPEVTGKPHYVDDRTAVLPVKLEPGKTYYLMINCPSGHHFVSAEGVAADSVPFRFTTGTGGRPVSADRLNLKAWQELEKLLETHYSHLGRTGTDWKKAFAENREWVVSASSEGEWLARAGVVLGAADDPHIYFRDSTGKRQSTHQRRGYLNANPEVIRRTIPNLKEYNPIVSAGSLGEIGYLAINGWESPKGECDAIDEALAGLKSTRTLILDVRANGGGSEDLALKAAGFFLEKGGVYARHQFRDTESPTGWSAMRDRYVAAGPPEKLYRGRVLLLQGSVCLSSNEAFIEMMRLSPRTTTMGATTGGSSGNPKSFPLPNGAEIIIPRWESYRLDGSQLEGHGIAPDIAVDGDFGASDPVLMKALEWCRH